MAVQPPKRGPSIPNPPGTIKKLKPETSLEFLKTVKPGGGGGGGTRREAPQRPNQKTVAEMIGETLREAGVLIAVFGWLDNNLRPNPNAGPSMLFVLGLALLLFVMGVVIERFRTE